MNQPVKSKASLYRTVAAAVFALTLALMAAPAFSSAAFHGYSGGLDTLDMRFGYSAGDVYTLMRALGSGGRAFYARYLYLDLLFTVSFAVVQDSLMRRAMGKTLVGSVWRLLPTLAYPRAFLDISENCSILFLMARLPAEFPGVAAATGFVTQGKFILLGCWLAALPVCYLIRKNRERRLLP